MCSNVRDAEMELLDDWLRGDKHAGELLLRRHYFAVKKFFITAVPDDAHSDLTQKTFLKVVSSIGRFEGRSSFKTYIFSIARHTLYDYLRQLRRGRGRFEPLEDSIIDHGAMRPSELLSQVRRRSHLLDYVRVLPLDTKQLLELYYWQDFTAKELAEVFETSLSAIKGRLGAAKKKLANQLTEAGEPSFGDGELEAKLRELGTFLERGPSPVSSTSAPSP